MVAAILQSQGVTQAQAADLIGADQSSVSHLACQKVERFSFERLFRYLNDLDRDVEIRIRPRAPKSRGGKTRVR